MAEASGISLLSQYARTCLRCRSIHVRISFLPFEPGTMLHHGRKNSQSLAVSWQSSRAVIARLFVKTVIPGRSGASNQWIDRLRMLAPRFARRPAPTMS